MEPVNFEAKRTIDNLVDVEGNKAAFEVLKDKIHEEYKIIFYNRINEIRSPEYEIYGVTREQLASFFNFLSRETEVSLGEGRKFNRRGKKFDHLNSAKISMKEKPNKRYDLIVKSIEGNEWFREYEAKDISYENLNKIKGYLKNYFLNLDK